VLSPALKLLLSGIQSVGIFNYYLSYNFEILLSDNKYKSANTRKHLLLAIKIWIKEPW
jgi:hypothetical protein